MSKQSIAVWHKDGFLGKGHDVSFETTLTNEGLVFDLTSKVEMRIFRGDSLGVLFIQDDVALTAAPWSDFGINIRPNKGDTVILTPKNMITRATLATLFDDKDKRIEELEALVQKLASDPDYTAAYMAGVADQIATIAELEKMIDNMTAHIRIDPDE